MGLKLTGQKVEEDQKLSAHIQSVEFFSPPPALLGYIWHIKLYIFKVYNIMIYIHIHCEMITSVMLINTFTTSHSYVCVCVCVCVCGENA